jgi:hypothetical protein
MKFLIRPYFSVGKIKLGMRLEDVHNNINIPLNRKYSNDPNLFSEDNHKEGISIEYENNICNIIELHRPAEAIYNNTNLFAFSYKEIIKKFSKRDNNIYSDGAAVILLDTGLGFYFTELESNSYPKTISIFRKGEYDEFLYMFEKII